MIVKSNIKKILAIVNKKIDEINDIFELSNCIVKRIKNYDWVSFLEIEDDSGMISATIKKSICKLKENDKINCSINIKFQQNYKSIQLNIISYEQIKNEILSNFDNIYSLLDKNGILSIPKKNISSNYSNIGIISSTNTAGLKDFLHSLSNNMLFGNIIIYPTIIQSAKSANNIIECIEIANNQNKCQILSIIRGGGSINDLECLNNYELAIAIKKSKIPIVSGIGHEIDKTIIDVCADKAYITPTDTANNISNHNEYLIKIKNFIKTYNNKCSNICDTYNKYKCEFSDNKIKMLISTINQKLNETINKYNNYCIKYRNQSEMINRKITKFENINNSYDMKINNIRCKIIQYKNKITPKIELLINGKKINSLKKFKKLKEKYKNNKLLITFVDGDVELTI